jgi:uroporphyrinogen decarboxylase
VNSRERVKAALEHRQPDRVPVDLGSSIVTGINAMGYARLKRHLGLPGPVRVTNAILLLAEVEPAVLERWGVDVLPVPRYLAAPGAPLSGGWREHPLPDGTPALFPEGFAPRIRADGAWELLEHGEPASVLAPGSGSFVPARFPLAGASVEQLEAWQPPRISAEELEFLHGTARRLYESTDKALFGWFNGSIFEQSQFLCGWDEFLVRLSTDAPFADRLLCKLTEATIQDLKLYLDAVGEYIQVVGFGDDLGFQGGLQVAPELFRSRVKPYLARIYAAAHSASAAKVFLHSCGSVVELIEDFIEIGVDILNPVQTSAAGMEPERLKREFGRRICFWGGGADAQRVLPLGKPEEVRRDVRRRLEVFGEGGGFVFAPIHNIQADVPPENVAAMYDEASGGQVTARA